MFTGLIEEIGIVHSLRAQDGTAVIEIAVPSTVEGLREGESIAVNGTCLTVTGFIHHGFKAELSPETLARTSFGEMQPGHKVNLERPLLPTTRLGGHFVQGHVDGVGKVVGIHSEGGFARYEFSFPADLRPYLVDKGSIAIDGISLTIACLGTHSFQVAVIPHTLANTNLQDRHVGDAVNLECDILAKYVGSLLSYGAEPKSKSPLTFEYLKEQGY